MAYTGATTPRSSDFAGGTLPLLAYLALAVILMVADHRGDFGSRARAQLSLLAEPFWWLASAPSRLGRAASDSLETRGDLQAENMRRGEGGRRDVIRPPSPSRAQLRPLPASAR